MAGEAPAFDKYFLDATLRIDYFHYGDSQTEAASIDRLYREGPWAGSRRYLLDPFNRGRYAVEIRDVSSGELIFSKGFDSYFGEYRLTDAAARGVARTYHESALIPYPRAAVEFRLLSRDRRNELQPIFRQAIDPASIYIIDEKPAPDVAIFPVVQGGTPAARVDIAVLAEGYTAVEKDTFSRDLQRVVDTFFGQEPYKSLRDHFNITGVYAPSAESRCDEPGRGLFRNTALGATFHSLGSSRYMLTEDNRSYRDLAGTIPYDAVLIMVNHTRYGGGGIYNTFCTFTSENQWFPYLFLHEFGHSFTGLADEYYTSSTAYNDFYLLGLEPLEPNITALLDPDTLKWKHLVAPDTPLPTPWEKEEYDRLDLAYQKIRREMNEEIERLTRSGAPEEKIQAAIAAEDELSAGHSQKIEQFLRNSRRFGQVGAFEGAGYCATGMYRPMLDCIMFSKGAKPYCRVCEAAIVQVIRYYCNEEL
ncbi:MAG: peptidase M64, partial [Acidobacteria bacterium]|nr:peptidase M64 [Acidobacteriota bacterium]